MINQKRFYDYILWTTTSFLRSVYTEWKLSRALQNVFHWHLVHAWVFTQHDRALTKLVAQFAQTNEYNIRQRIFHWVACFSVPHHKSSYEFDNNGKDSSVATMSVKNTWKVTTEHEHKSLHHLPKMLEQNGKINRSHLAKTMCLTHAFPVVICEQ